MKKRILVVLLVILALSTLMLVSCKKHTCDYATLKETKTEATCTEAGAGVYECECGETTEKEIPAKGHTNETKTVDATCKDNGYTVDVCTACGTESNKNITTSAGDDYHKFDKLIQEPADCKTGKKGRDARVCSICGDLDPSYTNKEISPAHDWDEENPVIVEPTCTEDGSSTVKCKNCGAIRGSTSLPSPGHDWEADESTRVEATCDKGTTVTEVCSKCGETQESEADDKRTHDIIQDIHPATCTEPAIRYEECGYDDCDYYREIGSEGQMLGHDVDKAEYVTVPETCQTPGSRTPICNRCEEAVTYCPLKKQDLVEIIDPCDCYKVSEYAPEGTVGYIVTNSVEASCHNERYEEWKCISDPTCTSTKTEYFGGKLPHTYVYIDTVYPDAQVDFAPTCLSIGYKLKICTNCIAGEGNEYQCEGDGETPCYEHEKTSDEVAHDITTVLTETYVDSTCIKPATVQYECQYCGQTYDYEYPTEDNGAEQVGEYSFVALKEHGNWKDYNQRVESTCTSYGYSVYICRVDEECTETSERMQTRYAEHRFNKEADGRFICQTCGVTYRDISSLQLEYIDQGTLDIDGDGNVENDFKWYVIGYENPKDPTPITPDSAFNKTFSAYVDSSDGEEKPQLSMTNGVIMLETEYEGEIVYTITITDFDGNENVYTITAMMNAGKYQYKVTSASKADYEADETVYESVEPVGKIVYFDLYSEGDVASIDIESTQDATVRLFSYESKEAVNN